MEGEWRRREVSQLMGDGKLVIGDGYRAKNDEFGSSGLPFARAGNINEGFLFDDADHFPEENLARVGNKVSQPGDVVFTSKGTVGRFAFVRPGTPRFVYSPQLCFWRSLDQEEIDPRFLYYWMFGREFFVQFKGVAGQTDMAEYVSLTDQRRMHITLPGRDEQRAIAHILGTLDDRIELNRRMNETLEAMARAIFKSWFVDFLPVRAKMAAKENDPSLRLPKAEPGQWFVYAIECEDGSQYIGQTEDLRQRWQEHLAGRAAQWTKQHRPVAVVHWEMLLSREEAVGREKWLKTGFGRKWLKKEIAASARTQTGDPVRAKAEGRDPGLPKPLADLFPDSFEDSELGEVPKGWKAASLADCVDVVRGLSYKGSGLSDAGVPMHNLNSIYEGGGYKHEGIKHYEGEYKPHHVARAGDLIVANTEQGHDCLLIGYAAIIPARFDSESLFSHHIYRVRPKSSSGLTPDYLCQLLNTSVMHDTVSGYANGTTVNMLPIDGLQSPQVVVPPSVIVRAFNGFAEAARKRHEEMIEESHALAAIRDALLPKLLSGELRVLDMERGAG